MASQTLLQGLLVRLAGIVSASRPNSIDQAANIFKSEYQLSYSEIPKPNLRL